MVSLPSLSMIQPTGKGSSRNCLTLTLPPATTVGEMSTMMSLPGAGMPQAKGLTERRRSTPPQGATSCAPPLAVDSDEADEAGGRDLFGVFAEAADMAAVAQGDGGEGAGAGFLDCQLRGVPGHALAEALVGVEHGVRGAFAHNLQFCTEDDIALAPQLNVGRAHAHAVGIVAAQVGADEMVLQARDLLVSGAERRENVGDGLAQFSFVQDGHGDSCRVMVGGPSP